MVTFAAVAIWAWSRWNPPESPTERAYQECAKCGLTPSEVDMRIDTIKHSRLNREQSMELYSQQSAGGPEDARECEPCSVAVLDAAGK